MSEPAEDRAEEGRLYARAIVASSLEAGGLSPETTKLIEALFQKVLDEARALCPDIPREAFVPLADQAGRIALIFGVIVGQHVGTLLHLEALAAQYRTIQMDLDLPGAQDGS